MSAPARTAALALTIACAFASGVAHADPVAVPSSPGASDPAPAVDPAAAEALFAKGRKLMESGKNAEACPIFDESYRLDPAPGTLLNIAACSRIAGKTATSWSQFVAAGREFRRRNDPRRAAFAEDQAKSIEPMLAYVRIHVSEPVPGLTITRDGTVLKEASLDTKLPMDPGAHDVVVEAQGRKRVVLKLEAEARTTKDWIIPPLEIDPDAGKKKSGDTAASDELAARGRTQRIAGIVVGSVGIASLIAGAVFVGLSATRASDLEGLCPNKRCSTDEAKSALDEANLFSNAANGLLIAGGVVAATGLVVILTAPSAPSVKGAQVELAPAPGGARLFVRF